MLGINRKVFSGRTKNKIFTTLLQNVKLYCKTFKRKLYGTSFWRFHHGIFIFGIFQIFKGLIPSSNSYLG